MSSHKKNVIPFPSKNWKFFDFIEDKVNVIQQWYDGETEDAQNAFDKLLKQNIKIELPLRWLGYRHKLTKDKKNLVMKKVFELEFKTPDNRANRVMCVFNGEKRMVMLCGCYHKSNVWTPAGALEAAERRAKLVLEGKAVIREREI